MKYLGMCGAVLLTLLGTVATVILGQAVLGPLASGGDFTAYLNAVASTGGLLYLLTAILLAAAGAFLAYTIYRSNWGGGMPSRDEQGKPGSEGPAGDGE